jgi:antirestriction protein ArdC
MTKQDRIQQLRQTALDLAAAVANPTTGDETFDRYLNWISRFHSYSFGNISLILSQRPGATYVAGYRTWQQLGRQVRGGEKGIAILVPMRGKARTELDPETQEERAIPGRLYFGVGHVFDVSQSDGKGGIPNFKADLGGDAGLLLLATTMVAEKQGIEVASRPLFGSTNGYSEMGRIVLNSTRPVGVLAQTAVHELAHEILHDKELRQAAAHPMIEGEAEAVSVVVMRAFGFETVSNGAAYVRSHGATKEVILRSLDRITAAARTIIDGITLHLPAVQQMTAQAEMRA